MDEQETARFIQFMRHQFSKIPKDLSPAEYRDKADRYRMLSKKIEGFESAIEKKKYSLLAQKCEQLATQKEQAQHPVRAPSAVELIQDTDEAPKQHIEMKGMGKIICGCVLVLIGIFFLTSYPVNFVLTSEINYILAIIFGILGLIVLFKKKCC